MVVKAQYYKCFSINQLRWIKCNEIYPIGKNTNKNTGRTFWIFEVTPELSQVLTAWTENKKKKVDE